MSLRPRAARCRRHPPILLLTNVVVIAMLLPRFGRFVRRCRAHLQVAMFTNCESLPKPLNVVVSAIVAAGIRRVVGTVGPRRVNLWLDHKIRASCASHPGEQSLRSPHHDEAPHPSSAGHDAFRPTPARPAPDHQPRRSDSAGAREWSCRSGRPTGWSLASDSGTARPAGTSHRRGAAQDDELAAAVWTRLGQPIPSRCRGLGPVLEALPGLASLGLMDAGHYRPRSR